MLFSLFPKVVFQHGLGNDGREHAKIAIARSVMFSAHHISDRYLDDPFNKDQQRKMYRAGYEAAMRAKRGIAVDMEDFPTINRSSLNPYITGTCFAYEPPTTSSTLPALIPPSPIDIKGEYCLMLEYMRFWWEILREQSEGNPAMQLQADHVTVNRTKFLSIGHIGVCPRTFKSFCVATGFPSVESKTDTVSVHAIETCASRAFKAMSLEVAHSIVTDRAARSLGPALEQAEVVVGDSVVRRYGTNVSCPIDVCMMHDLSKVAPSSPFVSCLPCPLMTLVMRLLMNMLMSMLMSRLLIFAFF